MADEKSEWGEAGQPAEGGVLRDDGKPARPSRKPGRHEVKDDSREKARPPAGGDTTRRRP
jgi:hypothetical protein